MPIVYIKRAWCSGLVSRGVPDSIMIEKPFTPAQLVTAVSQLLNARPPRALSLAPDWRGENTEESITSCYHLSQLVR